MLEKSPNLPDYKSPDMFFEQLLVVIFAFQNHQNLMDINASIVKNIAAGERGWKFEGKHKNLNCYRFLK